jgi:hypothetical protein
MTKHERIAGAVSLMTPANCAKEHNLMAWGGLKKCPVCKQVIEEAKDDRTPNPDHVAQSIK